MKINNWPYFSEEDISSTKEILNSSKVNYWTGKEGINFESEFKQYIGTDYALATSNGTVSLLLAYSAINLKEGDELITTPRGYIAAASIALELGAKVVFAEISKNSGLITPETIEPLITRKTKAIAVVHVGGWPARMPEIMELANKYNLKVIEDCAQAHGGQINQKKLGSFGDISIWSFCQDKLISTAGEGGMITTNKKEYWEYMWSRRDHGKSQKLLMDQKHKVGFKWLHANTGLNYRMTEIQSAIGRNQLKKLDSWINLRSKNAKAFTQALSDIKLVRIPEIEKDAKHAWYKFYIYLRIEFLDNNWTRERIIKDIQNQGYPAFTGACPEIYLEKVFNKDDSYRNISLPIAKELGQSSLMFVIHPTITKVQLDAYIDVVKKTLLKASK